MTLSEVLVIFILYFTTCDSKMEPFIQGGEFAKIENFPHSVLLYMVCENPQSCGGSVLTQQVVLTAAHCFEDCFKKHDMVAYAGSEDMQRMLEADNIVNFRMHKKYNTKTLFNDIALGYLKSPFKLGKTIKRVIISQKFPAVTMVRTAGWGIVDDNTGAQSQKLKMVTQIIQRVSSCEAAVHLIKGMMCAKNSLKNHPSHGDSGSALVSTKAQQVGLVSFRTPNSKEVVVYTNVSYYYDWIQKQSKKLYCMNNKMK